MAYSDENVYTVTMNKAQMIKALKAKGPAFAWCNVTEHDGTYIKIDKQAMLRTVMYFGDQEYDAVVRDGGLHIN